MRFEQKILFLSLLSGLAGTIAALAFLWTSTFTRHTQVILSLLIIGCWLGFALGVHAKVIYPLRTLSNLLEALREDDFSMRIRGARRDDALGELILEVNALAQSLQDQRRGAAEATALLRKILAKIDVALFGFDGNQRLQLINDSGQHLLAKTEEEVLGRSASDLGLDDCLQRTPPCLLDLALPAGTGRWELRRATYREKGMSHELVFLSDLTRTLHEEERQAWKRLIQILRHEINNSLTPIQSVAQSLQTCLQQTSKGRENDLREGLQIIAERSEVLGRFIASYSQLTRLPEPTLSEMKVHSWVHHVAALETRLTVDVTGGPEISIRADRSQLDQLLINVVSNAVEACMQSHPQPTDTAQVTMGWDIKGTLLHVWVDDNGPGLDTTQDPFVPFFTTKPQGSGIGLALSRQIAEAHGGDLTLINHAHRSGCRALLRLPLERR
jgi:nitrogen fixation/metabolism regulation signal transduction histidine kinase